MSEPHRHATLFATRALNGGVHLERIETFASRASPLLLQAERGSVSQSPTPTDSVLASDG